MASLVLIMNDGLFSRVIHDFPKVNLDVLAASSAIIAIILRLRDIKRITSFFFLALWRGLCMLFFYFKRVLLYAYDITRFLASNEVRDFMRQHSKNKEVIIDYLKKGKISIDPINTPADLDQVVRSDGENEVSDLHTSVLQFNKVDNVQTRPTLFLIHDPNQLWRCVSSPFVSIPAEQIDSIVIMNKHFSLSGAVFLVIIKHGTFVFSDRRFSLLYTSVL